MIDFRFNYPVLPAQDQLFQDALRTAEPDPAYLRMEPLESFPDVREAAARWLSRSGRGLSPDSVRVTCGGHHALTVILLAAGLPGSAVVVDPLTYNGFMGLAAFLGVRLLPGENDGAGMKPDALRRLCEREAVRAVYLMPTIHNPLGTVMPLARRRELVAVAEQYDLLLIDDDAYGYLAADAPASFFELAPERSFYIYSLSKVIAPGLKTGFLLAPDRFREKLTSAIRVTTSGSVPFYTKLVGRCMQDGRLAGLIEEKREDARQRQDLARLILAGIPYTAHPTSYHLWLPLPFPAEEFSASLRSRGVDVIPGQSYSPSPVAAINGVRVALGSEKPDRVREGLTLLADHYFAQATGTTSTGRVA